MQVDWTGVYPAVTTKFTPNDELDLPMFGLNLDAQIAAGVHGLILGGTLGESSTLTDSEKDRLLEFALEKSAGRVPVIMNVAEGSTRDAVASAKRAEKLGADGLMLLPAMVYVPTEEELVAHFRAVAKETGLPIMLYNNPPAYRVSVGIEAIKQLADIPNIVCLKESAPDTRRFTDFYNAIGDKIMLFAGLDDVALEGLILGARGWVSGLTNAFPKESLALYEAFLAGDLDTARAIYRWFMPLLHLDAEHDLVQSIKLAEQVMGRGSERVRPPRYPLAGARRAEVIAMVEKAAATRPKLKSVA